MTSFTSEYDSNIFTGEKMQRDLLSYFFSLTTDINCISQNPLVPMNMKPRVGTDTSTRGPGVRVEIFCSWLFVNSLSSADVVYSDGR